MIINNEKIILDAEVKKFINHRRSSQPISFLSLSLDEKRDVLRKIQDTSLLPPPIQLPPVDIETLTPTHDSVPLNLTIVRPKEKNSSTPAFIYAGGGGWVMGDYSTSAWVVQKLVTDSGATAIFVNYSKAPEKRFPTALEEICAAAKWVFKNGNQLGIDHDRLAIVGESAGANLAAAACLRCQKEQEIKFRLQVLMCPALDDNFSTTSYQKYSDGLQFTAELAKWCLDQYLPEPESRNNPFALPMRAPLETLTGMPLTLIQTAEYDILRDEAEAYGKRLIEAGTQVIMTRYYGAIHSFMALVPLANEPSSRAALNQCSNTLRTYLNQSDGVGA